MVGAVRTSPAEEEGGPAKEKALEMGGGGGTHYSKKKKWLAGCSRPGWQQWRWPR